jgi:hypothetical protein
MDVSAQVNGGIVVDVSTKEKLWNVYFFTLGNFAWY